MDQMLEIIQAMATKKTFSEGELKAVGGYLVGEIPLDKIVSFLPKGNFHFYRGNSGELADQIGDACKKMPDTLLPRLGRFLTLMRHCAQGTHARLVERLLRHLPAKALFLESSFGPQAMLEYYFGEGYGVKEGAVEALELLAKERPGAIEEYIQGAPWLNALRPLAWLCAGRGEDMFDSAEKKGFFAKLTGKGAAAGLGGMLANHLLFAMGGTVKYRGRECAGRLRDALSKRLPAALPVLNGGGVKKELDIKQPDACRDYRHYLHGALYLTQARLPCVNAAAAALCDADYRDFLNDFYWTVFVSEFKGEISLINNNRTVTAETAGQVRAQLERMTALLEAMGIDRAYLVAWAEEKKQYAFGAWGDATAELYGGDEALLERAAQLASPSGKSAVQRALALLGKPVADAAAASAAKLLAKRAAKFCDEDDARRVADWLRDGDDSVLPAALPPLEEFCATMSRSYRALPPHYDQDFAIWALAGLHPIAGRYAAYLAAHRRSRQLEECGNYLTQNGRTPVETAMFLTENAGVGAVVGSLADCSNINEGNQDVPIRQVFWSCVAADPGAAAEALPQAEANGRLVILEGIYRAAPDYDEDFLIGCLGDKSKKLRQLAISYLMPRTHLIEKVRPLLTARKKDLREAGERLMAVYEGEQGGGSSGADAGDLMGLCNRILPRTGMSSIKWAIPGDLPSIRRSEGDGPADELVVKCYLYLMLGAKTIELPPGAERIRQALNEDDLHRAASDVYHQWIADGAPAKQKAALLFFAVHAADGDILILQKQIDEWADRSRGAIAAEAVRAMVLCGSDLALMTVDNIGRKYKNKQVRRAGQEAFAGAAAALGVDPEVLGDRIIPTLGFDERGQKIIDYGERSFTALLSPALTIELTDDKGKRIKSLPKPGVKDDAEKAERAKAEFTALKKSLKAVVATQTQRLETALATGRKWDADAWKRLYVQNPIMHSFAIGLIWGVYNGETLKESFRYMEDGSFTTVDEDEFDLEAAGESPLGLVHPLDLGEELCARWKQQLEDYEVEQPLNQVSRPVYPITEGEREQLVLDRFGGKKLLGITLLGKLQKSGWYKGSVQDAGCFYTFYKEIGPVGMQLYFSGMYVSPDPTEEITVGQVGFYRAGSVQRGSYVYDDVKKENCIPLKDVSARMFSELILDVENATATSTESDPHWKKDRHGSLLFFDGK